MGKWVATEKGCITCGKSECDEDAPCKEYTLWRRKKHLRGKRIYVTTVDVKAGDWVKKAYYDGLPQEGLSMSAQNALDAEEGRNHPKANPDWRKNPKPTFMEQWKSAYDNFKKDQD